MGRWKARMIWSRKKRLQLRVNLKRSHGPVGVFCIPACHRGVVDCEAREGERTRCLQWPLSQPIFQHFPARLLVPEMPSPKTARAPFPKPGVARHRGGALYRFELGEFGLPLGRVVRQRGRRTQSVTGVDQPSPPTSCERQDGIGAGPGTWRDWDRAGPFRVEAICFSALDGLASDRTPECKAAATSLGKPTAAMLRERPASSAMARNTSAFSGNR